MIYADDRMEFVGILISRRIVADGLSGAVGSSDLGSVLLDVEVTALRLREIENVRVRGGNIFCRSNHELSCIVVDQELRACIAESSRRVKRCDRALVLLTISQLLVNIRFRAVTTLGKPRGKFACAVLTHVRVLELFVAQKTDLIAAKITEFLIKKSHNILPCNLELST